MQFEGNLAKMQVRLADLVQYSLTLGEQHIDMNALLQKKIKIEYLGEINCIQCGRKTKKSFQQGYCFPCLRRLQECNLCIIHPERCLVELGNCDPNDWAHRQCNAPHVLYLANSSGLKVGITRENHIPSRWIDQGAIQAVSIFHAANRYQVGLLEVAIKKHIADKTNWRNMLKNKVEKMDLLAARENLLLDIAADISSIIDKYGDDIRQLTNLKLTEVNYPVIRYPEKITSLSLDKTSEISGVLLGIKGQYLIFDSGVINIRKFGGYRVLMTVS